MSAKAKRAEAAEPKSELDPLIRDVLTWCERAGESGAFVEKTAAAYRDAERKAREAATGPDLAAEIRRIDARLAEAANTMQRLDRAPACPECGHDQANAARGAYGGLRREHNAKARELAAQKGRIEAASSRRGAALEALCRAANEAIERGLVKLGERFRPHLEDEDPALIDERAVRAIWRVALEGEEIASRLGVGARAQAARVFEALTEGQAAALAAKLGVGFGGASGARGSRAAAM